MNETPVMKDVSVVLNEPEKPENAKAIQEYLDQKRPAEELLAMQRKWMDERHGVQA